MSAPGPKVWIDLSNSPHPLLFAPIARELEQRGCEVAITVRDHAQTLELARRRWPNAELVGAASGGSRSHKAGSLARRVGALVGWARSNRPDVALSHNSYSQLGAARLARIPAVTAMDFEHQPANHLGFRLAGKILVPEVLPGATIRRQGAVDRKLVRYPGFKEELYLGDFEPGQQVLSTLGIEPDPDLTLIVARSAPAGAAYHPDDNQLFFDALDLLGRRPSARCVVLARHPEQRRRARRLAAGGCIVPDHAIEARALLDQAHLFLGAGGTMTREAALLGIPTFSIFAGSPPAVDEALVTDGRMRRLTGLDQLPGEGEALPRRQVDLEALRASGAVLTRTFVETTLEAASRGR